MSGFLIDPSRVRDLAPDVIGPDGRLRIMPASYYQQTQLVERALLGARHGLYGLPTVELVQWVQGVIAGRRAIEIGAGSGVLAEALGIPATDSWQQQDPGIGSLYAMMGQPVVRYGANVEKLDAAQALEKYAPQVVVASWVTHQYREDRAWAEGNMWGVDEEALLDRVETYILIGNSHVHRNKSIWSRPHQRLEPEWVYSRASNGSPDFVAVWTKGQLA